MQIHAFKREQKGLPPFFITTDRVKNGEESTKMKKDSASLLNFARFHLKYWTVHK